MRGNASLGHVAALQSAPSQAQHDAHVLVHSGQNVTAAHVAEQPDGGFRHGEQCLLGSHPVLAVHGYANAAAHRNAVDQRDEGDFVLADHAVHRVLVLEEACADFERRGAYAVLCEGFYVATGTKRLAADTLQDHHPYQ